MRFNTFTICSLFALSILSAPRVAPAASPAQPAAQQSIDQLQSDYAQLKTEMNETLAQLRQLKAELAASAPASAAPSLAAPAPVTPPDATSLDRKIDQIIAAQTKLELKLAAIEVQQARADLVRQQAAATPVPNDLNSPYAYRYNANSPTPDTTAPPQPATYTTYSNGYTSGYYTPPVQAIQSTGQVVYVNPQPVIYSSPTYVYPGYYNAAPYYYSRPYYRSYYRSYYRPSSLSIGVSDNRFFFGFNTGVRFGGRDRHDRHH
jgi:outer membrane protein TolC